MSRILFITILLTIIYLTNGTTIAHWNIRDTGPSLFEQRSEVVPVLINQFPRWDLMSWQEIVDKDNIVVNKIVNMLNKKENNDFAIELSPRVGEPGARIEQYGYLYRKSQFKLIKCDVYPNPFHIIYRTPYVCQFQHLESNTTFSIISCHVKPSINNFRTAREISELVNVYEWSIDIFNETNAILLGDWNADCDFLSKDLWKDIPLWTDDRFHWYIDNEIRTSISSKHCSYDRIVVAGYELQNKIYNGRAIYIDQENPPLAVEMKKISDHYPIQVDFSYKSNYTFIILLSIVLLGLLITFCVYNKIILTKSLL
jgi:hypothetical protein